MALLRLVISNFAVRKTRVFLTASAIALSVSLVIAVTSGCSSIEASALKMLARFMGTADALIAHKGSGHPQLPESFVDQMRLDPAIKRLTARLEAELPLVDAHNQPLEGRPAQIIGIRLPQDTRIENLTMISGQWFDAPSGNVAVIDQVAAEKLGVAVGGFFDLPGLGAPLHLHVVGIVRKPQVLAKNIQSIYLPIETLQKFVMPDKPPQVNRVMIDLQTSASLDDFIARWDPRLAGIDPDLHLRLARDNRQDLDRDLQGLRLLSYVGGAISMMAAAFIVFSTLSMGVAERSRTLAMLRAVGAVRGQIAGLVVIEGLLLALLGVAIGVPLGWLWIKLLALKFNQLFTAGAVLSGSGMILGVGGSLLTALAASLLPARLATRVDPLEAMSLQAATPSARAPILAALAGLVLISVDSLLIFGAADSLLAAHFSNGAEIARQFKFYGHFFIGLPSIMFGFFLLAPSFVWILERVAGPAIAAALGLNFSILRQQLSSGISRAAGTCAALMVGIAILVAMETQGNTMLQGWRIPDKFPDVFIVSWPGLSEAQADQLSRVPGIKPGQLLPIAVASPDFGGASPFAMIGLAAMPDATMFFGIDPAKGLNMMGLEFRQGNPTDAIAQLKLRHHIIVTDEFRQLKHLGVGDTLALKTIHGDVNYKIAAVVWSPGIDVIVNMFDMGRQFDQRTAASVFGSIEDAKKDFGVDSLHLFAANVDTSADKAQMVEQLQKTLNVQGLEAGDVRVIKQGIQNDFADLLLLMAVVPFSAMAVASLGVTNTIMASIRTRRWQFGVLRSVGLTRWQLLRMILSEAVLVGLVGCAMGLMAGSILAVDAHELTRVVIGYLPPISVPWRLISIGTGVMMTMTLLASLWPAISVAAAEPLELLQAGRAAA